MSTMFTINKLPSYTLNHKSPFEILYHKKPDYKLFKVFACSCFPFLSHYNQHKFSFKTSECTFLGYSSNHKGYRCLHKSGRIYVSRSVLFNELSFPYCVSNQNKPSDYCFTLSILGPCPSHSFIHMPATSSTSHHTNQPTSPTLCVQLQTHHDTTNETSSSHSKAIVQY